MAKEKNKRKKRSSYSNGNGGHAFLFLAMTFAIAVFLMYAVFYGFASFRLGQSVKKNLLWGSIINQVNQLTDSQRHKNL